MEELVFKDFIETPIHIKAILYDGSEEMAVALVQMYPNLIQRENNPKANFTGNLLVGQHTTHTEVTICYPGQFIILHANGTMEGLSVEKFNTKYVAVPSKEEAQAEAIHDAVERKSIMGEGHNWSNV